MEAWLAKGASRRTTRITGRPGQVNKRPIAKMTDRKYGRDDVDYATWYSDWMKRLAKAHTRAELEKQLGVNRKEGNKAATSHLRAIERTTSMTSNSQRRAHSRNTVTLSYETRVALEGALEIYELFPEHTKESQE